MAYSAMFAAFYALGRLIPFAQFVGAPGFVPFSDSFVLLYAILLGPLAGSLSAVLGTIISYFLGKAPIFLGLDFLTPLAGVLVAGLMLKRKRLVEILVAFLVLLMAFNLSPLSLPFVSVPVLGPVPWVWLHLVALCVLTSFILFARRPVSLEDSILKTAAKCGAAAFVGLLFEQLVGDILFEATFGLYSGEGISWWHGEWIVDFYVYPPEWIAFTVISVIIALPVYRLVARRLRPDLA